MNEKLALITLFSLAVLGVHHNNDWVLVFVLVCTLLGALWLAGTLLWDNRTHLARYLPHAMVTVFLQCMFAMDRWAGVLVCGLFVLTAISVILKEYSNRSASSVEFVETSFRISSLLGWNMLVGLLWTTIKLSI